MLRKKQKREGNKQNKKYNKYGQVKLRASMRGVYSCLFALASLTMQLVLIRVAYRTYGEAQAIAGSLGLIAFVISVIGVIYGINGFREREKSYRTCKAGIFFNGLIISGFVFLYIRGLV